MKKQEIKQLKKGDKLYLPTQEDIIGGLATISNIEYSHYLPKDHYNYAMVSFEGIPNTSWNLNYLLENQEEWSEEYKDQVATPNSIKKYKL